MSWSLASHVCATCAGRILEQDGRFMCGGCGAESQGMPHAICGCGIRTGMPGNRRFGSTNGFHCGPNPAKSPISPADIVILFGERPAAELATA